MAISIYEGFPGREGALSENPSDSIPWVVMGTSDATVVKMLVKATTPPLFNSLFLQNISYQEVGIGVWQCSAKYGPRKPPEQYEYKFSFDTTGGQQKITQSLQTVHKYAPAGKTAADHKGAIGVTDHGVEGCQIIVPKFSWSETWQLPIADYGWAYSQTLKALTGKVNSAPFRGFAAGQVLFQGGKGGASSKDPTLIEISFGFDQSDDVSAQTIGDITGVAKTGWQYLWVHYIESDDATAKTYVRKPDAVYVEKVYESADFSTLQIGT